MLTVRRELVWDHDIPEDPERDEGFVAFYVSGVAAVFDRAQPKDYVDVYFLAHDRAPLDDLVEGARKKHLGMDDYFLAQAFARAKNVSLLSRMVRPLDLDRLRSFFLDAAEHIMTRVTG